jgi:hypothetical protein
MTPDSMVWIPAARARVAYHVPLERRTVCGLFLGDDKGHFLPVAEVVERFGSKACRRCFDGSGVPPRVGART